MDGRHTLQFNRLPRFWHGRWRNPTAAFLSILFLAAGYPSSAIGGYTESFQTWSATSADTWQTKSLAGAPWNVPANAVVEVVVRNGDVSHEFWGGVRAVWAFSAPYLVTELA